MTIRELRILPPLAIGRLGAAPMPMDNYDVEVDPGSPARQPPLVPATTLEVDPTSGEITRTFVPDALRFTQDGKVRPVAPFLEAVGAHRRRPARAAHDRRCWRRAG